MRPWLYVLVVSVWVGSAAAEGGPLAPRDALAAEREVTDSVGTLKPVYREEVFQFARKPAVRKAGDGTYEISFASAGRCDVAVAVEDADGRMVRHLVYGVLGANAPEPFKKDSLEQTVVWDGKDDLGRPTTQPDRCRVRVSLGLDPTFNRVYGYHPKMRFGWIHGMAADEGGVYVFRRALVNETLTLFDHQGRYVRTLIPFSDARLDRPEMQVPTERIDGRLVASRCPTFPGSLFKHGGGTGRLAAAAGWVVSLADDGELIRMRLDGTTGNETFLGPMIPAGRHKPVWPWGARMALSPDGRWVYLTGIAPGKVVNGYRGPAQGRDSWLDRVVFRVERAVEEPIDEAKPFIGTTDEENEGAAGGPETRPATSWFQGIACDGKGQIYVCDYAADLVRVYDPKGRSVTAIPVTNPREIDVHKKTGEIYVLCEPGARGERPKEPVNWGKTVANSKDNRVVLRKLGAVDDPKQFIEQSFKVNPQSGAWWGFVPVLCVDSWSQPTQVWLSHDIGSVRVYAEQDGRFELIDDFDKDVRDAGLFEQWIGDPAEGDDRFAVDPVRGHLYRKAWGKIRCCTDLDGPGQFQIALLPRSSNDISLFSPLAFSADGLLYYVTGKGPVRLDPAKTVMADSGQYGRHVSFPEGSVVPFAGREEPADKSQAIRLNADYTFAVGPDGSMTCVGARGGRTSADAMIMPRWDRDGRHVAETLLTGFRGFKGVKTDAAGAIYAGVGFQGKFYPPPGFPGKLTREMGLVAKFAPGSKVQFNELSAKAGQTQRLWSCPNYLDGGTGCGCPCAEFAVDGYGRSFIPQAIPATVAVLDANGNRICQVGRYGNVDSPDPATANGPVKGADIRLAWCIHAATFPDKWLYLWDDGNARIVRVKLGYVVEEQVALP